ncbi:hypothetical protein SteCoe_4708 [Stentor coeruleus]|uniref:Uncharacterized protein n=1 Tax=Stentor coeruleus TaxID=5963 RepID=A0A1R2CTX4_9CILI|nr:hypothetical protein SteCoe_4708 [Stentor coeruleus]
MLIKYYSVSKIQASEYSEDIRPIHLSGVSQVECFLDSSKSLKVTAQEAAEILKKMKVHEKDNMELENRIQLLHQHLAHLKQKDVPGSI